MGTRKMAIHSMLLIGSNLKNSGICLYSSMLNNLESLNVLNNIKFWDHLCCNTLSYCTETKQIPVIPNH
jgi:hypothetical protein